MRGRKAEPLARGATYGCWTVVRESAPDAYGRARYVARATCCGREVVKYRHDLVKAAAACTKCTVSRKRRPGGAA
jgi:hypothetical protein